MEPEVFGENSHHLLFISMLTKIPIEVPSTVHDAFTTFASNVTLLALPLKFVEGKLQSLPTIPYPEDLKAGFQAVLSRLDTVVDSKIPLYFIIRRDSTLNAITYIPHLAPTYLKTLYLECRNELVRRLGESHFTTLLICKEAAEITDVRSWEERDMKMSGDGVCLEEDSEEHTVKDLCHHKNKCRLCDRRMTNKIEKDAKEGLNNLSESGDCVQIVSLRFYFLIVTNDCAVCRHANYNAEAHLLQERCLFDSSCRKAARQPP